MAEQYTGTGYKIWLNRQDTSERITNENIWVGNRPRDGKSKVTSGKSGSDYAYVIFETWGDVLAAVGETPKLSLSANTTSVFDPATSVTISIYDCNCDWTLSTDQTWATISASNASGMGNKNVTLSIAKYNNPTSPRNVTVTATYAGGKTQKVTITQTPSGTLTLSAPSSVGPEENTVTITVTSNTGWTLSIKTGSSYASFVGTSSGSGNGTVKVKINQNQSTTSTRDVVIEAAYADKTTTATITQQKAVPVVNPTINLTPTPASIDKYGQDCVVLIEVTNGVYTSYEMTSSNPNANYRVTSLENVSASVKKLHITFGENNLHEVIRFTITGHGKSETDASKTCQKTITLDQFYTWAVVDADYLIFTYEWTESNGKDLDSVTFIDGLATSPTGTYGYTFENGVGYGNGTGADDGHQKYIGTDLDTALLKFAGDNVQSGGEYTCVDFKQLNECIADAISKGEIPADQKIIIYLTGNWYEIKGDGYANITLTAYGGGEVFIAGSGSKYYYGVEGGTVISEFTARNIYVNAFGGSQVTGCPKANWMRPLVAYSTMAAFVYDYQASTFYLVDGRDLETLDGGRRWKYGEINCPQPEEEDDDETTDESEG